MEDTKEGKGGWMTVPTFGEWDMKNGVPDYSMDFSKIREMRKQNKTRGSLGNEDELLQPHAAAGDDNKNSKSSDKYSRKQQQEAEEEEGGRHHRPIDHHGHHDHSPTQGMKRFKNYFQCCIGA